MYMIRKFVVIILGLLSIADLSAMIKVSGVLPIIWLFRGMFCQSMGMGSDKGELVTVIFNTAKPENPYNTNNDWLLGT